jgi:hypothetical protein
MKATSHIAKTRKAGMIKKNRITPPIVPTRHPIPSLVKCSPKIRPVVKLRKQPLYDRENEQTDTETAQRGV